VERHAERVGVFVLNGSLALVYRVRQLHVEAVQARCGVLDSVVKTLIEPGVPDAGQVAHVTDLITEQVCRTTGHLEGAVETPHLDGAPVAAAQTDKGVAGGKVGRSATARGEVDFLLDLEERLEIGVDVVRALEAQARGVAGQVGFGIIVTVIQENGGYMSATVNAYISLRQRRHNSRSTNHNRNQLLLHQKLLRVL